MKSVRLDPELEEELAKAARTEGVTESEFIRDALRRRCQEVLKGNLREQLEKLGVIGAVSFGGDYSRNTGRHFTEMLLEKRKRSRG